MINIQKILIIVIFLFSLVACNQNNKDTKTNCKNQIDVSNIKMETKIIRFERELFAQKDTQSIKKLLEQNPLIKRRFFGLQFTKDSLKQQKRLIEGLTKMVNDKFLDTLYQDCQKEFGDLKDIQEQFNQAFKHIKYYFPEFKPPQVYTTITGLKSFGGAEFYVDKDIIVVSLEFFLGKKLRYQRDRQMYPDYIWQHFHKNSIVPFCLLFIAKSFNESDMNDKTILADMIFYGKSLEFVKRMMPCLPETILMRYTEEEVRNINDEQNKKYLWSHFLEKNLLFSTKDLERRAYLEDRPYIAEVNKKCPGRIGQWFGWRIIQKFMEKNKDVDLKKLMQMKDAQKIFQKATYSGQ
jgi:hypothetical protein